MFCAFTVTEALSVTNIVCCDGNSGNYSFFFLCVGTDIIS